MAKPTFNNCLCLALLVCGFDVVAAQEFVNRPDTTFETPISTVLSMNVSITIGDCGRRSWRSPQLAA